MIIVDSSFVIAYHNTNDVHHAAAARTMVRLAAQHWGRALLLEYVLLEVLTVLRLRRGPAVANLVADRLLQAEDVDFLPCSDFFNETLSTFRRERVPLSFTDAAIVTVARREPDCYVATFDADFRSVRGIRVVSDP